MKNPILTIAIPVYNGAGYIRETLDSIVSQLEDNVEILISDNASTDGTGKIVEEYKIKYPVINYFKNLENFGADRSFDLAVKRSSGTYVWLFSDDDLLEQGAITHIISILNKHKSISHIFVNYAVYSIDFKKCQTERAMIVNADIHFVDGEEYINAVTYSPIFMPSNIFIKQLWTSSRSNEYIGTGWIHYGVLVSTIKNSEAYCVSHPYIKLRTRAVWTKNGGLWIHTIGLSKIIQSMALLGYSQNTVDKLMNKFTQNLFSTFISSKRDGLQFSIKILTDSTREFFKYPKFWLLILPAFFVPNLIVKWALKTNKRVGIIFDKIVKKLNGLRIRGL
jgi:glycosyltransferase involved in cell wall biosynthesis